MNVKCALVLICLIVLININEAKKSGKSKHEVEKSISSKTAKFKSVGKTAASKERGIEKKSDENSAKLSKKDSKSLKRTKPKYNKDQENTRSKREATEHAWNNEDLEHTEPVSGTVNKNYKKAKHVITAEVDDLVLQNIEEERTSVESDDFAVEAPVKSVDSVIKSPTYNFSVPEELVKKSKKTKKAKEEKKWKLKEEKKASKEEKPAKSEVGIEETDVLV